MSKISSNAMAGRYVAFMRRFAMRKYLAKKHHLKFWPNGKWPYLETDSPLVLARFSAAIRQEVRANCPSALVFCRGQHKHFESMRPSLFRSFSDAYSTKRLLDAEADFAKELPKIVQVKRFERRHLPALLQHYGIHTSWLDVVDNLHVAIWFAMHVKSGMSWKAKKDDESGWMYFLATQSSGSYLELEDLRTDQHHLSTRLHTQHGVSLTRAAPSWCDSCRDLKEFVVATVRLRCNSQWRMNGFMASEKYLFPDAREDNTRKVLSQVRVRDLLRKTERRHGLRPGSLGEL